MSTDDWDPDRMMNGSYGGGMYGGGLLMVVVMLLLVGLVAALAVWAVRATHQLTAPSATSAPSAPGPLAGVGSPRDLLDQRLARGEISSEDYRATRQLLDT